jgi:hypothetical protein
MTIPKAHLIQASKPSFHIKNSHHVRAVLVSGGYCPTICDESRIYILENVKQIA